MILLLLLWFFKSIGMIGSVRSITGITGGIYNIGSMSFAINITGCPRNPNIVSLTSNDIATYNRSLSDPLLKGSVAWFFNVCTFNNASYQKNHRMFPQTVSMPCAGKTPLSKMTYNVSNTCGFMELYAYQEFAAVAYSEFTGGKNLTSTPQVIVNTPLNCQFYGAGNQDCKNKRQCYIWLRADRLHLTQTFIHEYGHTLNLQHSANIANIPRPGMSFWAYGDSSCIMGSASSSQICYNAPHARKLGYAKPIVDLVASALPLNVTKTYTLPFFTTSPINHMTLKTATAMIYISIRSNSASLNGADHTINADYDKVLSIHMLKSTDAKPSIIALVKPGKSYNLYSTLKMDDDYGNEESPFLGMRENVTISFISFWGQKGALVSINRTG